MIYLWQVRVKVDAVSLQSTYYSKLEKADILEMTVKYLNGLKRQRIAGIQRPFTTSPSP